MQRFKYVILWVCLVTLYGCENNKISPIEEQYINLKVKEKSLDEYIERSEKLEELNKQLQEKVKTIEKLKSVHGLISPMLTEVFQRIPFSVQLKEFFFSSGTIDLFVTVPRDQGQNHWEKFLENSESFRNIQYYHLEEKFPDNIRAYRILSDFTPEGKEGLFSPSVEKNEKEETKQESLSGKAWFKHKIQKLRQNIARGNKALENKKRIDEEIEKKIDLLQELEITFPAQIKTNQVLTDIYFAASESRVKIKHLRIKDEITGKSFSQKPIFLDVCASVTQLTRFINTIEKAAMIYQLDTFYLDMYSDSTSGCDEHTLKLYVFQALKPAPRRRINRERRRR